MENRLQYAILILGLVWRPYQVFSFGNLGTNNHGKDLLISLHSTRIGVLELTRARMKMPGKIALLSISTGRRQMYTAHVKLLLLKQQGDGTYLWCIKIPTGLLHQSSCTCSNNMQRQEKYLAITNTILIHAHVSVS